MKKIDKNYMKNEIKMLKYIHRHPVGECPRQYIEELFGKDLISSALYYSWIEENTGSELLITVIGHEKLRTHALSKVTLIFTVVTLFATLLFGILQLVID